MSEMRFLPKLCDFLKQHNTIYTVRQYKHTSVNTYVKGIGPCNCALIRRISNKDQLSNYVTQSGFASAEHWWIAICKFIPVGSDMWLFKVVVK